MLSKLPTGRVTMLEARLNALKQRVAEHSGKMRQLKSGLSRLQETVSKIDDAEKIRKLRQRLTRGARP